LLAELQASAPGTRNQVHNPDSKFTPNHVLTYDAKKLSASGAKLAAVQSHLCDADSDDPEAMTGRLSDRLSGETLSQEPLPKLLWVGGLPGSGCLATRSLLDGHPEILAFPFEQTQFFRFCNAGFYNLYGLEWKAAVKLVLPLFLGDKTFDAYDRIQDGLRFDHARFAQDVISPKYIKLTHGQKFELNLFLDAAYFAFREQWPEYRDRTPKYFCLMAGSADFPWEDTRIRDRSCHLIPYRDWMTLYESHRNSDLANDEMPLAKFILWKSVRFVALLKRCCDNLVTYSNSTQFFYLDFEAMRPDVESSMQKVAQWLGINYQESLIYLSVLGMPEDGCMADGSKPGKKVSPKPSTTYFHSSEFEIALNEQAHTCDYPNPKWRLAQQMRFGEAIAKAWHSSRFVQGADLSKKFQFVFEGCTFANRKALVGELRARKLSSDQGRKILATSLRVPTLKLTVYRFCVFLTFFWVYLAYRFAPEPKYYGLLTNFLMRMRLYFGVVRTARFVQGLLRKSTNHEVTV